MRQQVEQCTVRQCNKASIDGGYLRKDDIENAGEVECRTSSRPNQLPPGRELELRPRDSPAVLKWKERMASAEGQKSTKQQLLPVKPSRRSAHPQGTHSDHGTEYRQMRCVLYGATLAYTSSTSLRTFGNSINTALNNLHQPTSLQNTTSPPSSNPNTSAFSPPTATK